MVKRIFDISFSLSGVIILSPLLILISLSIMVIDRGPILFKQERMGRGGIPFYIYKFNSIKVLPSTTEGLFGRGDITQSTPLGKFLRKSKLNELPQLFNVLKGEMSIVGPRPEVEKWVKVYPERWARVLKVRPGITDRASVMFLNEEVILLDSEDPHKTYKEYILPKKLDIYEEYIQNYSIRNDLKIIFNTFFLLIFNHQFSKNKSKASKKDNYPSTAYSSHVIKPS